MVLAPLTYRRERGILVYEVFRELFDKCFSDNDLHTLRRWIDEELNRRAGVAQRQEATDLESV